MDQIIESLVQKRLSIVQNFAQLDQKNDPNVEFCRSKIHRIRDIRIQSFQRATKIEIKKVSKIRISHHLYADF